MGNFVGVVDDAGREAWRREMDGVRIRSGRLLAMLGLLLGTLLCLNTALIIFPLTIGNCNLLHHRHAERTWPSQSSSVIHKRDLMCKLADVTC